MSAVEDARAALDAAGARQEKINELIAAEEAKKAAIDETRKKRGSGRYITVTGVQKPRGVEISPAEGVS